MTGSLHCRSVPKLIPVVAFLMFVPDIAFAHTGAGIATGLSHGLLHPFSGLDHLCAILAVGVATVSLFALCHGYAHGAEMPHSAPGMYYALGFLLSTVTLHLLGIGMATLFGNAGGRKWLRLTGASIAVTGGALFFAG